MLLFDCKKFAPPSRKKSNFCGGQVLQFIHSFLIMTGKIKRLTEKGFGFITPDGGEGKDLFFHSSALQGVEFTALQEGDAVSFDTEDSEKGPRAINVARA